MTNLFFKQSPWSHLVAAGTFALLFTACGDEITEVTEVVGMQVVEAGDALPKCTADNEGAMVYSVDSAAIYSCIGKKWISMKGKDGKDGADGKDGKDGKNGINGTNGTNESSSCTAKALKNGKGYKIVCGGDSVGVVLNGKDGAKGAPGVKGDSGATGNNGLSAYEIAKAGGYTGTEEEWIASLKGDPGVKGDTGVAGTSCSAEEDSDGVKITCTDGKSFALKNGADGKDGESFVEGVLIDPRDKQIYRVVTIGEQTWMAENLNYKTENSWCGGGSAKNEGDCSKYGRLYTWAAAIDSAKLYKDKSIDCGYEKTCTLPDTVYGVCPPGWHLPDNTEWNKLFIAVGGQSIAGKKLKSQSGWKDFDGTSGNGTDAYGFSAFPAGIRDSDGNFYIEGNNAIFWGATEYSGSRAYNTDLYYLDENAFLSYSNKNYAFSVRCLKDEF